MQQILSWQSTSAGVPRIYVKTFSKAGADVCVRINSSPFSGGACLAFRELHSGSALRRQRLYVLVNSAPQGSIAGTGVLHLTSPCAVTGVEALWLPRNRSPGLA